MRLWTIGHSTLTTESFLDALTTNEIALLVDVRWFPGSRRHPSSVASATAAVAAAQPS